MSYGIKYAILEVDKSPNCKAIQVYLKHKTGISTVPNLFVGGESVGGCMDMKLKEQSGEFRIKLAPYLGKATTKRTNSTRLGLLWFPEVVNGHVARLTSLLSAIYCILCIGFYTRPPTKWAVLALAIDYLMRLIYGASYSVIGAVAAMMLANVPPKFACGPPKQFAALCGLFFSTFAAGLYIGNRENGGAVLLGLLTGAALLEGLLDFCLGCWMFGMAIGMGIVSPAVYSPYLNLLAPKKWAYEFSQLSIMYLVHRTSMSYLTARIHLLQWILSAKIAWKLKPSYMTSTWSAICVSTSLVYL